MRAGTPSLQGKGPLLINEEENQNELTNAVKDAQKEKEERDRKIAEEELKANQEGGVTGAQAEGDAAPKSNWLALIRKEQVTREEREAKEREERNKRLKALHII